MKASARNQFMGTVSEVLVGVVNAEVHISLKGGQTIFASITKESLETLAIKPGVEVIALVKASQIIIVTDFGGYKFSARNQLKGMVIRVKLGAIYSEIDIDTVGGNQIAVSVTNDSVDKFGLHQGQLVTAVFKPSTVILAIAIAM